jgi:hypothetical protein
MFYKQNNVENIQVNYKGLKLSHDVICIQYIHTCIVLLSVKSIRNCEFNCLINILTFLSSVDLNSSVKSNAQRVK